AALAKPRRAIRTVTANRAAACGRPGHDDVGRCETKLGLQSHIPDASAPIDCIHPPVSSVMTECGPLRPRRQLITALFLARARRSPSLCVISGSLPMTPSPNPTATPFRRRAATLLAATVLVAGIAVLAMRSGAEEAAHVVPAPTLDEAAASGAA